MAKATALSYRIRCRIYMAGESNRLNILKTNVFESLFSSFPVVSTSSFNRMTRYGGLMGSKGDMTISV